MIRPRLSPRADIMLGLAFAAVIAIGGILAFSDLDPGSSTAGFLTTVGGLFARNIGTAFDFEFGSSRGSRDKDAVLAALRPSGFPPEKEPSA